ncbi:PREDICTED: protein outspread isoform X2 [Rhagoletis zephyria]|uniref:protein outspread isoform X2 n=1 Tax=Rhagoletis zephyria TaxID=28612 RepID=UPI0008116417|nr:PREDICTED: protein outspread isoform X2 [Rhagoletis zephyria]
MSTTRTSDCRKFSPNIFNKSKCSHCFRQREEHSAAALECNRASRKVSKCGYLFVAPDWDFSNPLYRTKRWQRRWFVLYDDGELTYSVDEHPETVPQACIDMTKVLEVAMAEDVTGHTNSIAITAPDRVTFVKGTCPEESKWWLNILIAFPKSKGRHKRNATFPGGQATTTILQQMNTDAYSAAAGVPARNRHNSYHKDALTSVQSTSVLIGSGGNNVAQRKANTVTTTKTTASSSSTTRTIDYRNVAVEDEDDDAEDEDEYEEVDDDDDEDDGVETGEDEEEDENDGVQVSVRVADEVDSAKKETQQDDKGRSDSKETNSKVSSSCLLIEDIRRDEKTFKDIANTITNLSHQKNRWSNTTVNNVLNSHLHHTAATAQEKISHDETDYHRPTNKQQLQHHQQQQQKQQQQQQQKQNSIASLRPKSLPLAANSTPAIVSAIVKKIPPVLSTSNSSSNSNSNSNNNTNNNPNNNIVTTTNDSSNKNSNSINEIGKGVGGGVAGLGSNKCKSSPRLQLQLKNLQQKHESNQHRQQHLQQPKHHHQQQQLHHRQQQAHERGDPDGGCNLDDLCTNYLAKTAELRVNLPAEESLNAKKGWLMKQDNRTGDWTKHWFSLSGAALFYYRDPVSEERGVLDGVLDVNSLTNVAEVSASKSYAFQLSSWDQRRLILASLSPSSRNSWIAILRNIAGLSALLPTNSAGNNSAPLTDADVLPTVELVIKDDAGNTNMKSEIEKDFINAQRNNELQKKPTATPKHHAAHHQHLSETSPPSTPQVLLQPASTPSAKVVNATTTPSTPKSAHFSSDEEYRTASEGGRRDSVDWGSPLSPSPPITTSLLRNRERLYARSLTTTSTRSHKRSHSSPPTSRRSTVDSVGSDELSPPPAMHPVQEELNIDKELQFRLSVAEKERNMLRDEAKERETRMSELLTTLERTEQQLNARLQEMEAVRDNLTSQLEETKRNAEEIVNRLTEELEESQKKIKGLEDRLARGIDENEALYKRVHELEGSSLNSFSQLNRAKLKRMDSLSDLTQIGDIDPFVLERDMLADEYNELRTRFEKAVNEIRAMKRELKQSQNQFDSLEISYTSLKQDLERKELEDRAQVQMMAARIQDLTLKYSSSERQVRTLKQKMAKSERSRSLSLKGREQLSIPKELELKVCEIEAKIDEMEKSTNASSETSRSVSKKSSRRRSLESNASNSDPLQFMLRLNDLEKRLEDNSVAGSISSSSTPSCSTPTIDSATRNSSKVSEHLLDRLRCLESVLVTSRDRVEQSLHQLQNLRSSHSRRSVSPITDRKDSYRFVERCLSEVVKLIRESCETCVISGSGDKNTVPNVMLLPDSNPVKIALTQLESQLRTKLAELLKQRRVLRERNELTERKNMELLAERVAFESVCFGKLRDSVMRAENPELFGERQTRAEVAETSHLVTMLKAKLSGKCALKSSGTIDILAGVLARRLMLSNYRKTTTSSKESFDPIDQNIMDDLLRQQNEINLIAKRYKNNVMENLASGLAAETLSYISSNDLVQGAVQEAWRQAQETVNAELVQSEIAHIMLRNAERFEQSLTPSFGFTLTAEERLSFEKFADAVHDALRKEMELAVAQLTQCYKEAIQKMKRGQWRLQLEQERKISEGRQLLPDFADIIAHKALVDARIAVLRGEYVEQQLAKENTNLVQRESAKQPNQIGITALQRYESLFEELSSDLQINNPADILADADFEFIYKQHTIDFFNERQVLSEISTFLSQLEDSLIALQCEASASASTTSMPRSTISIESLQDVCHKCGDLRQRADQLCQEIHRALNTPCQHCRQVHEKMLRLQQQHESEMIQLQQAHAKDKTTYVQQLENQCNAFKKLEAEKDAISAELQRCNELLEMRASELARVNEKLHTKEQELRGKQGDQLSLLRRFEEQAEQVRAHKEESNALVEKCARQDEEYAVLLQERDYLQSELNKEKERSRRFERRLEMLELEHSKQLECLQETYRDQLMAHSPDFSNVTTDDESFRQRYQAEIEQLRTLCEKGLSAMESSHRRIVADLEEKHRQEMEGLLLEKETALAEETQATLAALDAMRKAHQSEVQREVARFKQEFLKQFQKGEHSAYTAKANEEELEELRREILSFSEKFSIKCVENASLEEKLRSTTQKLKHLQQMQQLELRNKQFRAHLASEDPSTDAKFVQGLCSTKDDGLACEDSEQISHAHVVLHDCVDENAADVVVTSTHNAPSTCTIPLTIGAANSTAASACFVEPPSTTSVTKTFTSITLVNRESQNIDYKIQDHDVAGHRKVICDDELNIDNNDNGDNDELNANYYTYEPCYKQSNLYYFQSRLSFEGLKSSTFGKKLRTTSRKCTLNAKSEPPTEIAASKSSPASSNSVTMDSAISLNPKAAIKAPKSSTESGEEQVQVLDGSSYGQNQRNQSQICQSKDNSSFQKQEEDEEILCMSMQQCQQQSRYEEQQLGTMADQPATVAVGTANTNNSHKSEMVITMRTKTTDREEIRALNLCQENKPSSSRIITTLTTTKPVEQPKISSANKNIYNHNYNSNNINKKNNSNISNTNTNTNIHNKNANEQSNNNININNLSGIKCSSNNNNNTNSDSNRAGASRWMAKLGKSNDVATCRQTVVPATNATHIATTKTTRIATSAPKLRDGQMCIAERNAINLNSFTEFVRKTTTTANDSLQAAAKTNTKTNFDRKETADYSADNDSDSGEDDCEDDDDDVGDDKWPQQQQREQQQYAEYSKKKNSLKENSRSAYNSTTAVLERHSHVPNPFCSPTSGSSGSDVVEQTKWSRPTKTATPMPMPTHTPTSTRPTSAIQKQLRRFELEI